MDPWHRRALHIGPHAACFHSVFLAIGRLRKSLQSRPKPSQHVPGQCYHGRTQYQHVHEPSNDESRYLSTTFPPLCPFANTRSLTSYKCHFFAMWLDLAQNNWAKIRRLNFHGLGPGRGGGGSATIRHGPRHGCATDGASHGPRCMWAMGTVPWIVAQVVATFPRTVPQTVPQTVPRMAVT